MNIVSGAAAEPDLAAAQDLQLTQFMRVLANELASGEVILPSWSRVTERARAALAAPDFDIHELARLLGAEAGLAVRVLALANSAMCMRGARPLSDLKLAILRIGHDMLRSAVYGHALLQLRQAPKLQRLKATLQQLWREGTQVATLARLVAARTGKGDADAALLAGLLHNIGKLYLYVRFDSHADGAGSTPVPISLLTAWHARIGSAIARNWQMPESLCQAIADQDLLDNSASQDDLAAALSAAVIGTHAAGNPAELADTATHLAEFTRFGLNATAWCELLECAQTESTALRVTFGD
ncbi:MAG: HDOD domain-containing protein [Steroidobacteraceae bacterium]